MPEYGVAAILGPYASEIERPAWPRHVTVVPNFETELDPDRLAALLRDAAATFDPFLTTPGTRAMFNPDGAVPVVLAEPAATWMAVHLALRDPVLAAGARFLGPYHGEAYVART